MNRLWCFSMELLDEGNLREFVNRLPELYTYPPQVHLLMLAVRSRKAKQLYGIKMSDVVVERKIIRATSETETVEGGWRERYYSRVYNLAQLQHHGLYEVKGYKTVPEVMAIYGTLSPRHVYKALAELMKDNIQFFYEGKESANIELMKTHVRYFSCLHKHRYRENNFVTLDLDVLDGDLCDDIVEFVEGYHLPIFMITETSRGYHIVVDLSESEHAQTFYGQEKVMQKLGLAYADKGLEIQRDSQEPIPGTKYYRDDGSLHYVTIVR